MCHVWFSLHSQNIAINNTHILLDNTLISLHLYVFITLYKMDYTLFLAHCKTTMCYVWFSLHSQNIAINQAWEHFMVEKAELYCEELWKIDYLKVKCWNSNPLFRTTNSFFIGFTWVSGVTKMMAKKLKSAKKLKILMPEFNNTHILLDSTLISTHTYCRYFFENGPK